MFNFTPANNDFYRIFFLIYEFSSGFIRKIYERGIRVIAHWIYLRRVHILMVETEEFTMMIIWGGTLAILLNRFRRNLFRVTRINHDIDAQIKRIGVYYMCIDDLPI